MGGPGPRPHGAEQDGLVCAEGAKPQEVGNRAQKQVGADGGELRSVCSWPGLDERKLMRGGTQNECLHKASQVFLGVPPAQGPLAMRSQPSPPLPPPQKVGGWGQPGSKHDLSPTDGITLHFTYT